MMQTKDVERETEQQPFSGDLHISTQQEAPEIKILLHICKVAFGLDGTVHPKQAALCGGNLCFHILPLLGEAF